METIQNIAAAATKAIYGDQSTANNETAGQEPVAGQTGKGTADSPYDQGNATEPISTSTHPTGNTITATDDAKSTTETTLPDRTAKMSDSRVNEGSHSAGSDPTGPHDSHLVNKADPRVDSDQIGSSGNTTTGASTSDPTGPHDSHLANKADPRVDSDQVGSRGNTTGANTSDPIGSTGPSGPSSIPTNPNNAREGGAPDPHQSTDKTGVVGGHGDPFTTTDKSTERSSNPGPVGGGEPQIKQQGAANPSDAPSGQQNEAVKDTKNDAEDFLKTKDPNDHSGEPMHMHTGGPGEGGEVPKTQQERRESNLGQPGGQEHGKEEAEGTGEQWVKSSGIAADGGDFDATKPGAGREANRLMEEKGIHKTEPGKPAPPPDAEQQHKEKVPLGQKIKDKLHIGSHKE